MMIGLGLFLSFLLLSAQVVEDLGLNLEQLEDKLFFLVNQERNSRGLAELQFDPQLRALARAHSQKMFREKQLAHDFPGYDRLGQRAALAGLYFHEIGENVAKGDTFVMRFFHEQFLASPGHRENILGNHFRQLGIGIELQDNMYYVTQEFADLFEPHAQLEMENEIGIKLKTLFSSRAVLPEASAADIRDSCRRMASLFLQDQSPKKFANSFGVSTIHNFGFSDPETVYKRISAEVPVRNPLYWSLGITFARSAKNPGGIYALTLILFPDLRDSLDTAHGLDGVVLKALNTIRNITMMPRLAKQAEDIAGLYYQFPASPDLIKNRDRYAFILVYQTASLTVIPDAVAEQIANSQRVRSTAIHVLYPLAEGLTGNYFIVVILGK